MRKEKVRALPWDYLEVGSHGGGLAMEVPPIAGWFTVEDPGWRMTGGTPDDLGNLHVGQTMPYIASPSHHHRYK